jgi:hypothetical protein
VTSIADGCCLIHSLTTKVQHETIERNFNKILGLRMKAPKPPPSSAASARLVTPPNESTDPFQYRDPDVQNPSHFRHNDFQHGTQTLTRAAAVLRIRAAAAGERTTR